MACDCETYVCLTPIPQTGCLSNIPITLTANQTGTWILSVEFNGLWKNYELEVTSGEQIILPLVFNESYTHSIKFYRTGSDVYNDTCYTLDTSAIDISGSDISSESNNNLYELSYVIKVSPDESNPGEQPEGDQITDSRLAGKNIRAMAYSNQYYSNYVTDFTIAGSVLTLQNGGSWIEGDIVQVIYKNA